MHANNKHQSITAEGGGYKDLQKKKKSTQRAWTSTVFGKFYFFMPNQVGGWVYTVIILYIFCIAS